MENLFTPNCIRTYSGIYFNVFEPTLEMICIEDIAHSLSNQCRFGGHLHKFYSVAQHCVMCSSLVKPKYKLQALLHDAAEAYILDMPSPIKNRLVNYKKIEDSLMTLISQKFGFKYPIDLHVKEVDDFMLKFEWDHLIIQDQLTTELIGQPPQYAEYLFLEEFNQIVRL